MHEAFEALTRSTSRCVQSRTRDCWDPTIRFESKAKFGTSPSPDHVHGSGSVAGQPDRASDRFDPVARGSLDPMLALSRSNTFGDDTMATSDPVQRDQFIANGILLSQAEQSLRDTYAVVTAALLNLSDPNAVIPTGIQKLMHDHNEGLTGWTTAVSPFLAAYNATKSQLPADQQGTPQMPPAFTIATAAGLGAAGPLRLKDIRVVYGPMHAPITTTLGDPNTFQPSYNNGLGAGFSPLFWIAAIVMVSLAVDWAVANYRSGEIEASRTSAIQSYNRIKEAEARRATFSEALRQCIGTATDTSVRQNCTVAAGEAVDRAYAGLPVNASSITSSWAFWVGVILLASAVGVGGYMVYRRNKGGAGSYSEDTYAP